MQISDLEAQAEVGFTISPATQKEAALRVLAANPDTAFQPKEIATRADIPADNAPTVCRRLAEMGAANTENGHYYLPQDDETAAAVRRALGSAHQRDLAQKTAAADSAIVADEPTDPDATSLSEAKVDAELTEMGVD